MAESVPAPGFAQKEECAAPVPAAPRARNPVLGLPARATTSSSFRLLQLGHKTTEESNVLREELQGPVQVFGSFGLFSLHFNDSCFGIRNI